MILHTDRYFEHQYDVRWDMLCVKWPDIETIYLPELYNSVGKLIENVRNFNIRHLLIDASESRVFSTYEEADQVAAFFIGGLKNSHLQKLARIESADAKRESHLIEKLQLFKEQSDFEIRLFKDRESALKWLEQGVNSATQTSMSAFAGLLLLFFQAF